MTVGGELARLGAKMEQGERERGGAGGRAGKGLVETGHDTGARGS